MRNDVTQNLLEHARQLQHYLETHNLRMGPGYVTHKLLQIMHANEYLVYFPLTFPRQYLEYHDKQWKVICQALNWKFYLSVEDLKSISQ